MNNLILNLENKNIFTNKIILVRSILVIGTFLTLTFNNLNELTDLSLILPNEASVQKIIFFKQCSIFELFGIYWGKFISIVIILFVLSGYIPQISCILQAWLHLSICNSILVVEGGDQIASNLSILLIPICLFDNRINQWDSAKTEFSNKRRLINIFFNVYYFLITIQVAIIYFHSAVGKLFNDEWKNGTCVYYWFTNNVFGAPLWLQKIYNFITLSTLAPILTWSIIIFEISLFACILATNNKIRKTFLILGLLFHFGIVITHGLVTFFLSMAGALILYLDDNNIIYEFLKKIKYKIYGINISNKIINTK
jgi:antimicrobial peptide system SdpB family protein